MPWHPSYTEEQARQAIKAARTWMEALESLGRVYHGKNVATLRKWAERWGIDTSHLPTGKSGHRHRYTPEEARVAIAASRSWAEALRRLGYTNTGANPQTLRKRAREWRISTAHFDPAAASRRALSYRARPLGEILVRRSSYSRSNLKRRLYESGLKTPRCELCGQGEIWRGRRMSLILDHVNGVPDDNRLENLRIVCPNCAATLDTHCGRKNEAIPIEPRQCRRCGTSFQPRSRGQLYCSRYCGTRWSRQGLAQPGGRKVERPPFERLLAEIDEHGYLGVGRRYGVSDNAVRKWVCQYQRERAIAERAVRP